MGITCNIMNPLVVYLNPMFGWKEEEERWSKYINIFHELFPLNSFCPKHTKKKIDKWPKKNHSPFYLSFNVHLKHKNIENLRKNVNTYPITLFPRIFRNWISFGVGNKVARTNHLTISKKFRSNICHSNMAIIWIPDAFLSI